MKRQRFYRWMEPGYRFYTDEMKRWLGGYEPVLAGQMCTPLEKARANGSRMSSENRQRMLEHADADVRLLASNTFHGLSKKSDAIVREYRQRLRKVKA